MGRRSDDSLGEKGKKKDTAFRQCLSGPSVEIRTQGLLNPIQARYQTSPHPDTTVCVRQLNYNSTGVGDLQGVIEKKANKRTGGVLLKICKSGQARQDDMFYHDAGPGLQPVQDLFQLIHLGPMAGHLFCL